MSRTYTWLPIFVLLAPGSAAAQVNLAWRFKVGEQFFVKEVVSVRQTIKIMDAETRQEVEETKISRFAVLKTQKDSTVLEQTIQSLKIKHSGEGPDVDTKVLKQLEGARFQVTLDARGQVVKLSGYDDLLKKFAKDDPLNARLVRALMTEESFKVALVSLFGFVPGKAVAKGDSWDHKSPLPLGPLGVLTLDDRYTLEGVDEASMIASVSVTGKGSYAPPQKAPDPALKITCGEIRLLSAAGTLYFDAAHGRLQRSEIKSRLEGTLQVSVRGSPVTMQLEQEGERKVRVLEKDPSASATR